MIQVEKFIVTIITQSFISFLFVCVCVYTYCVLSMEVLSAVIYVSL